MSDSYVPGSRPPVDPRAAIVSRVYEFPVRLVIGTGAPLREDERRKLAKEISATLAVHLDIAGSIDTRFGKRVTGDAYILMPVRIGRQVKYFKEDTNV